MAKRMAEHRSLLLNAVLASLALLGTAALAALPALHEGVQVAHVTPRDTRYERTVPRTRPSSLGEAVERVEATRARLSAALAQTGASLPERLAPNDFFDFIPSYAGSLFASDAPVSFSIAGACFANVTMSAVWRSASELVVSATLEAKRDVLCDDLYLFGSIATFHVHEFELDGTHTISFGSLASDEIADLMANGMRVFHFESEVLQDVVDFVETLELFLAGLLPVGPPSVPTKEAELNLAFLHDRMNISMAPRSAGVVDLPPGYVQSGDFFGVIRLDGLDPMIAWGMGAHTGHTVMALEIDGELYITESQTKSHYWPNNFIQRTPYAEWVQLATQASYNVVHLPLTAAARAAFNQTAAVEHFLSVEGVPYGFANFLFGWLDTADDNIPQPLSQQLVMVMFALLQKLSPGVCELMWNQALNHRLNSTGLDCYEIYATAQARGLSFGQLIALPELDEWRYLLPGWASPETPVPSYVCDVYVCAVLKAAGLFAWAGVADDEVNCVEFTNWDVYSLDFFQTNPVRPEVCVKADPDNSLCQITGAYSLELNLHGTVPAYAHMREHCGGLAPAYYWGNNTC